MKLNPVFKKELSLNARTMRTSWIVFFYNIVLMIVAILMISQGYSDYRYTGYMAYSNMLYLYIIMSYIEFGMLLLIVPAITSGAISQERERQTLDILLSTQMKPYQIIIGKMEISIYIVFILAVSSMPVIALTFMFGGIGMLDIFALIFVLVVETIVIGSIGIFYSSICKKTTLATLMTYLTLALLIIGTYVFAVMLHYFKGQSMNDEINAMADIHNWIAVLLVNPAITFGGIVGNRAGNRTQILNICSRFGEYADSMLVTHWIIISMIIQLIIAFVLIFVSALNINPLKSFKLFKK